MKKAGRYIKYAIIVLSVVIVVLFVFFIRQYVALRRADIISTRELRLSAIVKNHGPATANEVSFIRSWMTFDYINTLFNIPSDYLKTHFSITDTRYPKLSISEYAGDGHLNRSVITNEIMVAIRGYLTNRIPD